MFKNISAILIIMIEDIFLCLLPHHQRKEGKALRCPLGAETVLFGSGWGLGVGSVFRDARLRVGVLLTACDVLLRAGS